MPTFKEAHPEIEQLVLEHAALRAHNRTFEASGRQHGVHLMFAEGALVCLMLERFVRAVLGYSSEELTLRPMLEQAVARGLFRVPWDDQQEGVCKIMSVRNRLLHGDFDAAAVEAGCRDAAHYLGTQYAGEVETMYKIVNHIVTQVDADTGRTLPAL